MTHTTQALRRDPGIALEPHAPPVWLDREAYPFRSRWFALPHGGGRLHYLDEGEGEAIVFVHGTPTWSFEWRHLVRALASHHRCIAPDLLGFGLSDRPVGATYTPEAHAERLVAFIEGLELERFTLVVHDFGGPIALPLAVTRPDRLRALVVIDTWMWAFEDPRFVKQARMIRGALGRFAYRWLNASLRLIMPASYGDRRKLTRAIHRQYLAPFADRDARERVLFRLALALLDSHEHYAALWQQRHALANVPTALVWGLADAAFPSPFLDRWREALPNAQVTALEGVGHWPHEEAPERVLQAIEAVLARAAHACRDAPKP